MKKQILVIGLGRFGESLARTLSELGVEVLAADRDEELVNRAITYATQAVQLDAVDEAALNALGVNNFDVVCICIGEVEPSILVTLLCKDRGVAKIVAKASSDLHAKVLNMVGADRIVFPERDYGVRLAHSLVSANLLDYIELSEDYSIAEFYVAEEWQGKSISELNFRRKYGLNIMAIRYASSMLNINPMAGDKLAEGDIIVVIGSDDRIANLERIASKK